MVCLTRLFRGCFIKIRIAENHHQNERNTPIKTRGKLFFFAEDEPSEEDAINGFEVHGEVGGKSGEVLHCPKGEHPSQGLSLIHI